MLGRKRRELEERVKNLERRIARLERGHKIEFRDVTFRDFSIPSSQLYKIMHKYPDNSVDVLIEDEKEVICGVTLQELAEYVLANKDIERSRMVVVKSAGGKETGDSPKTETALQSS